MGRSKLIYDTRDLENATADVLARVDKAILAAAFRIRDDMRSEFKRSKTDYKYSTQDYYRMSSGIMVGKLNNSKVKIHALGHKENDGTWKARFFVGGTTYRQNEKGNKGFIKSNEAVDRGLRNADTILNTFINNTLNS